MECMAASKLPQRLLAIAVLLICSTLYSNAIDSERLPSPAASPAVYQFIHHDLNAGRANDAISLLQQQLSKNSTEASAHNLLCRVYIQEERWTDAEQECKRAIELDPNSSSYHQWLGRAYGGAAAHASLVNAYSLAKKVHVEFETAVRLDTGNLSALSEQMLRQYLASGQQSEDAPVFQVYVQLGNLLASDGDRAGAEQQYAAAHNLASNYEPAQLAPRG